MKIINLTPHALNVRNFSGTETIIPTSGMVARIETEFEFIEETNNIPFFKTVVNGRPYMCDLDGIVLDITFPDMEEDTIYIVSGLFRSHFDRDDLWQPGKLLRDDGGKVIGSLGLSR